jgi:O-antigen/teichoic acid export membrane protein
MAMIFFKSLARLFSLQVLGLGCGFIVHLLLARILGAAEYGVYNFIFSLSMLAALVGNFGFQASSTRVISQLHVDNNTALISRFFNFSALWVLVCSLVSGGVVFYGLSILDLNISYSNVVLLSGVALTVLIALVKLHSGILKGFKQGAWALAYESSFKEIIFLVVIVGLLFLGVGVVQAEKMLLIVSVIFFVLVVGAFFHVKRMLGKQEKVELGKPLYKEWLTLSLPMMLVISAQVVIHRSDIVMLGFLSDAFGVGVYSAGAKIAQAATLGMMVLNIVFSPRASEAFHQGNTKALKSLYLKTLILQAISTIVLAFGLILVGESILAYLGTGYEAALPVLCVLVGGYALNALWGPVPFLMIMTKFEYQAMWFTFAAAILNIVLNIFLIPVYGILGAAIATVISLNLRNCCALFFIVRRGLFSGDVQKGLEANG